MHKKLEAPHLKVLQSMTPEQTKALVHTALLNYKRGRHRGSIIGFIAGAGLTLAAFRVFLA